MSASTQMIGLPQMIDLACGTPESGVMNFNALHALLHVVVQKLKMQNARVEFQGDNNTAITNCLAAIPAEPTYVVTEYRAENDDGTGSFPNRVKKDKRSFDKVDTILVVRKMPGVSNIASKSMVLSVDDQQPMDKKTKSVDKKSKSVDKKSTPAESKSIPAENKSASADKIVPTEKTSDSVRQPIAIPATDDFRQLADEAVVEVVDSDATLLPETADLVESISESKSSSVDNMYNILNLSKRLDAAEITIHKLIGMLQEMGAEYNKVNSLVELSMRGDDVASIKDQLDNIEQKIHTGALQAEMAVIAPPPSASRVKREYVQHDPNKVMYPKVINPSELPGQDKAELESLKSDMDYIKMAVQRLAKCSGQKDIDIHLTMGLKNMPCPGIPEEEIRQNVGGTEEDDKRMREFEVKYEQLESRMVLTDKRVYDLEKEFAEIGDRLEDVIAANEARAEQEQDQAQLFSQLNEMKTRLNRNTDQLKELTMSDAAMRSELERALQRLKVLDETKIDREEVDEMMAEKADYHMVQRKVSSDHFDATKRELGLGLEEMSAKIDTFDDMLKQNVENLRLEVMEKMNRNELEKVREFFMAKLQLMHDRLKALSVSRREPEAAGSKSKYLRDVECLSCEQKVVMRRDEASSVNKPDNMVAMKSMRPQLTYELDHLRKELHQTGTSRNMHHFEQMYKGAGKSEKLCNRYCGGSHTAISAQENYQKRNLCKPRAAGGNNPDVLVRGTDGTMYKAGPFEECRCMDGKTPTADASMAKAQTMQDPTPPNLNVIEEEIPKTVSPPPTAPALVLGLSTKSTSTLSTDRGSDVVFVEPVVVKVEIISVESSKASVTVPEVVVLDDTLKPEAEPVNQPEAEPEPAVASAAPSVQIITEPPISASNIKTEPVDTYEISPEANAE